jgi:glycosyltransferase involved in cell wall biosynthesis
MLTKALFILKSSTHHTTGFHYMNNAVLKNPELCKNFEVKYFVLLASKNKFGAILKIPYYKIRLLIQLLSFKPDLVYFTISSHKAFIRDLIYVFIIKTFSKASIVYHLHTKGIREKSKLRLYRKLYWYAFKNVNVICLSPLLKSDFDFLPIKSIKYVGNAIDLKIDKEIIRDETSCVHILFFSNFILSKGILDLLDALEILNNRNIKFTCDLTGGELDLTVADLVKEVKQRNLASCVNITLAKSGKEKLEAFKNADIFVHPTREDVWGLVILEAMEASLPVVATIEGAIPEIIHDGITGYLVPKGNVAELANSINKLIQDYNLRISLGSSGRKDFLQKYTMDAFNTNLLNALKEITEIDK